MKKYRIRFVLLLLFVGIIEARSQDKEFTPKVFGTLKAAYETDLQSGDRRFITRNERIGIRGKAASNIGYKLQTEFNAGGKFTVLDAYGEYYATEKLTLRLGQMFIPFAEDYVITPGQYIFASMSLIYPYTSATSRDIGANFEYKTVIKDYPVTFLGGVYNGSGINKPTWNQKASYAGRVIFGNVNEGFRWSLKYYSGAKRDSTVKAVNNYGLDFRYKTKKWEIEGEWNSCDSLKFDNFFMSAYFIQGAYYFWMKDETKQVKYIMPTARFESIGNEVFKNGFDVSRMTFGVNVGFDLKPLRGEIRFNYENVFVRNESDPIFTKAFLKNSSVIADRILKDKIVLELLLNF